MGKLYDELTHIIEYKPDAEVEKQADKWCKTLYKVLDFNNVFPTMMLLFVLFLYWFGGIKGCVLFVVLITTFVICYKSYNGRKKVWTMKMMNECDFNKILTVNMTIARNARRSRDRKNLLPGIGNTLFYLGRFEEAKKVADLYKKNENNSVSDWYRVTLCAIIAGYEMDRETVERCIKELEELMPQVEKTNKTQEYESIKSILPKMDAEEKGDYAKAKELMTLSENATKLDKVRINYGLYKVAKVAGLDDEATKHRDFVLENGGDTFYKRELESVG